MKKVLYILTLVLAGTLAQAQVKVGANPGTINGGSALEIEATNKGLLMPRVALTTTTTWGLAGTAVVGMSVYNTATGLTSSNPAYPASGVGEYYWDGTGWVSKKSGAQLGADNGLTVGYNSTGNVGLGGTLSKNTEVATAGKTLGFSGLGFVGVGTISPRSKLALSNDGGGNQGADDISIYSYGSSVAPSVVQMSSAGTEAAPANIANGTSIGFLGFGGRWNNGWNMDTTTVSLKPGVYQMTFVYEGNPNATGCDLSSYIVDFPTGTGSTTKRIHSTAAHNQGGLSNHGGTISFTTVITGTGYDWQIRLGRGQSGNCTGTGNTLGAGSTQLTVLRY